MVAEYVSAAAACFRIGLVATLRMPQAIVAVVFDICANFEHSNQA